MPVQQQMSSFAQRLGGRVAAANAEHRDKPVDTGNRRLPAGIRSGIAKLSSMYTKQQTEDGGKTPKGETFFRGSAVVLHPEQHAGEKVAGMVTSIIIPLCDTPAKGQRKAVPFSDNWFEFQNLFKLLGITPPAETTQTDPTGQKTEAYYFAAMKALTDPQRPPVFIEFSTRGWTPPASQQQSKPEEMVFETWHGLASPEKIAQLNGQFNPATQITEGPPLAQAPTQQFNEFEPPPTSNSPVATTPEPTALPTNQVDLADEIASLVETAMNDPEGATEEGAQAAARLEELAWQVGWTKEQTTGAADWAAVGDMALNPPGSPDAPIKPQTAPATEGAMPTPVVGSKWKFAKRAKDGAKLKNNKGEEFPPQEVEVVTVDVEGKTCTLKTVKDGKDVVDLRTKKPVVVKFEWLE